MYLCFSCSSPLFTYIVSHFISEKASYIKLSTSAFSGTIKKITVNTCGGSGIAATLSITVGSTNVMNGQTITKTNADYSTGEISATGEIVISWSQTSSKAIYIKSITIEYTPC